MITGIAGLHALDLVEQLEAVHPRHPHVRDDHQIVAPLRASSSRARSALSASITDKPAGLQRRDDHAADVTVVVDHQDTSQSLPP